MMFIRCKLIILRLQKKEEIDMLNKLKDFWNKNSDYFVYPFIF